ncbi:MAG: hypothetical protein AAFR55_08585 [Pseudomonadota bacterium]
MAMQTPDAHTPKRTTAPDVGLAFNPRQSSNALILDLLEWIGPEPRAARDVLDAWRTSCPRLTVWEDAADLGLARRYFVAGQGDLIEVTTRGKHALRTMRPLPA